MSMQTSEFPAGRSLESLGLYVHCGAVAQSSRTRWPELPLPIQSEEALRRL
eukprot:CAMPEP_0182934920 /NCGR_PEP_ID=MMETSP0105_2-20130417/37110_1 /TAXON_ID=81532 ORGANISM="Acanthoeca-like sp., Strain 10tr" /NCGR_SAMPLE_ID=MMETSP0105_2 /ASSEMBLY_ACC=CAM_ASM_000205 /LENGTH=50 /DNA_ID=CAMNT_0025073845 /DNA_START=383 /DNA_END=531 /DNA_ORIENTATION=-